VIQAVWSLIEQYAKITISGRTKYNNQQRNKPTKYKKPGNK